jgi:alpha-beta hydrolase superfamily lysophospholipase
MEPKNITITLKSGEKLYAWYMAPTLLPRAIICLCHGWGEHSLRYKHWADRFVAKGYGFISWDHIGHGQSEGQRGHIKNYGIFMEEINLMLNKAGQIFPGVPIVLYGHSMGGNIAINFALRESNPFKLLIATSPWLRLTQKSPALLELAVKVLNKTFSSLSISAPLNAQGISHVQEVVEQYKTDPLNHGKITPKLVTEITNAGEYAIANIEKLKKPLLLIHGDSDPITSYKASCELASKSKTCSFIPFKDMYHELHNETINEEVFNIIKEWISGNLDF